MKNTRALVTGGAGFIGSNLVQQLLIDGYSVRVIDNLLSGHAENLPLSPNLIFTKGDIRDRHTLDKVMQDVDVVFHLAASVGNKRSIDYPIDDAEINVLGTINVLESARNAGVRKIVASSSAGIYGELKTVPIKEGHPIDPDTPYGSTKLCMEKECLAYAKIYDMEAICLRYFNVYGPNQRFDAYGNVIPIFVFKMLRGETLPIFGDGYQTRDFINVKDVVQANIKAALNEGISGAFNIGSASQISINALVEMLHEVSGLKPNIEFRSIRAGDVEHSLADISAAQEAFGFNPDTTFLLGLSEYFKWAKKEFSK